MPIFGRGVPLTIEAEPALVCVRALLVVVPREDVAVGVGATGVLALLRIVSFPIHLVRFVVRLPAIYRVLALLHNPPSLSRGHVVRSPFEILELCSTRHHRIFTRMGHKRQTRVLRGQCEGLCEVMCASAKDHGLGTRRATRCQVCSGLHRTERRAQGANRVVVTIHRDVDGVCRDRGALGAGGLGATQLRIAVWVVEIERIEKGLELAHSRNPHFTIIGYAALRMAQSNEAGTPLACGARRGHFDAVAAGARARRQQASRFARHGMRRAPRTPTCLEGDLGLAVTLLFLKNRLQ